MYYRENENRIEENMWSQKASLTGRYLRQDMKEIKECAM